MPQKKITFISFLIAASPVFIMWVVFLVDCEFDLQLYRLGNHPLHPDGLPGILLSPWIHSTSDVGHILNNSLPMFILTWMLFYHYRIIATKSLVLIWILSGLGLWLIGRDTYHVGMSGIIYGLSAFLTFSGFFRKSLRVAGISLLVIFLYGSMVWGIFPLKSEISWEGHAAGLVAGILVAFLFRKSPPQQGKFRYELEEEAGIGPEIGDWKGDAEIPKKEPVQELEVRYYYKKKNQEQAPDEVNG